MRHSQKHFESKDSRLKVKLLDGFALVYSTFLKEMLKLIERMKKGGK